MKKNKMMRTASALLVLVLLTVSVICGTFAKYTTAGGASDTASVAKWGVKITASGKLFDKTYFAASSNEPAGETKEGLSVKSSNSVVAPGTKNSTGVKISLSGTPETSVELSFALSGSNSENPVDVFLASGTLTDMTTNESNKTFVLSDDYYPIEYKLVDGEGEEVASGTLAQIQKTLKDVKVQIAAGTDLSEVTDGSTEYTLTWKWALDVNDKADTLLGSIAAGTASLDTANYSIKPDVKLTVTATQLD